MDKTNQRIYVYPKMGEFMNTVTVSRWGNSLGLRIPKGVIDAVGLTEGDTMAVEARDGVITVRKVRSVKRYTLAEALGAFQNVGEDPSADWGTPQGREEW